MGNQGSMLILTITHASEHRTVSLAAFGTAALRLLPVGISLTGKLTLSCLKFKRQKLSDLKPEKFCVFEVEERWNTNVFRVM